MSLSKTLLIAIDILIAFMLLIITISIVFFLSFINSDGFDFFIFISEDGLKSTNQIGIIKILFHSISYLFFFAIVYYLRKSLKHMVKNHFFSTEVAKNLNMTGLLLTLVSLSTIVVNFLKQIFDGILKLGIDPFNLNSELFMTIIGLFFMLMSRVINEGIKLRSENELTI